jgi:hypothetical protein
VKSGEVVKLRPHRVTSNTAICVSPVDRAARLEFSWKAGRLTGTKRCLHAGKFILRLLRRISRWTAAACRSLPFQLLSAPHIMKFRTFHLLAVGIVWLATANQVAANETGASALLKLRQGAEPSCQPTLPHFCENMHVRCSGQTSVPTFEFKLRNPTNAGTLELTTTAEDFQRQYESPTSNGTRATVMSCFRQRRRTVMSGCIPTANTSCGITSRVLA